MLKMFLITCAAAVALFTSSAFAQSDKAGESRAAPAKPATKEEKAAAKEKRRATGKDTAKADEGRTEDKPNTGTSTKKKSTSEEKAAAKSKRKAEGAEAAKNAPASAEGSGK